MVERTKLSSSMLVIVFALCTGGVAFAEQLCPLRAGQNYLYTRSDPCDNEWTVRLEVNGQMTENSFNYFHIQVWNYDNDSNAEEWGYVRSTEQVLYDYNPKGDDYPQHQKAPLGTKWSFYREYDSGYNYKVIEIVDINDELTVPFGTFDEAYKSRRYRCVDPNDLGKGKSPDWYEWVVPGIGWVKQEDYWVEGPAPLVMELEQIHPVEPFYESQTVVLVDPNGGYAFIQDYNGVNCWAGEDYRAVEFVAINDNNNTQRIIVPATGFKGKQGIVLGYDVTDESRNGSFCVLSTAFSVNEGGPGGSGLPIDLNDAKVEVDIDFVVPEDPCITTLMEGLGFWIGEADGDSFETPGLFDISKGWHTYSYDLNDLANWPEGGGLTFGDSPVSVLGISFEDPNIPQDVNNIIYFVDNVRIIDKTEKIAFFEDFEVACPTVNKADLNTDCKVDLKDFAVFAENWLWQAEWY